MRSRWKSHDGKFIIEDKYHSLRAQPKNPLIREKRAPRTGKATQKQMVINARHRSEKTAMLIMDNFECGDWYITFKLSKLVSRKEIKKGYDKMMRRLRDHFKAQGVEKF